MNKEQLVKAIAIETQLSQKDVTTILNAFTETIVETRPRKERQGINPKTGEPLTIPATTVPAFSPGKLFKERVKP